MYKVGIIGGGQLGKMMILDGKRLDTYFAIIDPTKHCPADSIADLHIEASFDDVEAFKKLAENVDVITYEFEHINVEALRRLESEGHKVYPSSDTLYKIQDKYRQKQCLKEAGLPVPEFVKVTTPEDIFRAGELFGYPMMLKTCTGGYDGKGNAPVCSKEEAETAFEALGGGSIPLMIEAFCPFEKEVSVLVCRSVNGDVKVFPVAENAHKNSILDETIVPAAISDAARDSVMSIAKKTAEIFDAYGMLCIEMFVTANQQVYINELAPRPHNSGHYTIEGCVTSQYENHIRAILGLPLGSTELIAPTVMKNIIGQYSASPAEVCGLEEAYRIDHVKVHIYGKETVSKGRKMGHITVTDKTVEAALEKARMAHSKIYFRRQEEK